MNPRRTIPRGRPHVFRHCLAAALLTPLLLKAQNVPPNHVLDLDGTGDWVRIPPEKSAVLEQAMIEAWVKWRSFTGPGGVRVYLNGMLVATNDYTGSLSSTGKANFYVGRENYADEAQDPRPRSRSMSRLPVGANH